MTDKERQQFYSTAFESYRDLFGEMDQAARALWFFTMDEAEILSYPVSAGQDAGEASIRHGVKLAAMADALESLTDVEASAPEVRDLRAMARRHGYLVG